MDKPCFYMMCGLPGSGKSTHAKQLRCKVFSSDEIREELFGTADDTVNTEDKHKIVFQTLHNRIKECLKSGESAVYDATNINWKTRKAFLQEIKNIPCYKVCNIIATPYDICLRNNKSRDRVVPESVIKRMYMNWYTPYYFEGWDFIVPIYSHSRHIYVDNWLHEHVYYNQENSHHENSLGIHSILVGDYNCDQPLLRVAGYLHDCGKPFTKSFTDESGNETIEAHYYQHHCVGAYDVFSYDLTKYGVDKIQVSALVNYHMHPYFWEYEKTANKYRKIWGDEFYNNIMKLHEADKNSH